DAEREPAGAAAELEDALVVEVAEATKRGEVRALRVEHATHVRAAGLYAFTVVPRAPNFCAFCRVSSNFERAYVSTSRPVSIRSNPCRSNSLTYAASSSAPAIQPVQRSMSRRPSALTGFWIVTS